jgi:hypothetical protein
MEALELLLRDTNDTDLTVFARQMTTPANYALTRDILPERSVHIPSGRPVDSSATQSS